MLTLARPLARPHTTPIETGSLAGQAALAISGTALVALAAHVAIPLPFSPVPLTLQPFAVLLIGMMLGPATAFVTLLLYLAEGAAGLPVFSPLGPGGIAQLLGPTGGYLLSYPLAAASAGWIVRRFTRTPSPLLRGLLAATAAIAIIYVCGAAWLATLLHLSARATMRIAVLPFVPGEIVKIAAAAALYRVMLPRRP